MINSRKIGDLSTAVQGKCNRFAVECLKSGIDILITSTYRDKESQDALYAQGRTEPGNIVTNAKGGQSFHNWRVAFDVVPLINGKPVWNDDTLWLSIGHIGKVCGLEWAGDWKKFTEKPHFQYTQGLTIKDFQKGKHYD